MIAHGIPEYIRSDNDSGFIAKELFSWIPGIEVKTTYIALDNPRENGFSESTNGIFRDSLLYGWVGKAND